MYKSFLLHIHTCHDRVIWLGVVIIHTKFYINDLIEELSFGIRLDLNALASCRYIIPGIGNSLCTSWYRKCVIALFIQCRSF